MFENLFGKSKKVQELEDAVALLTKEKEDREAAEKAAIAEAFRLETLAKEEEERRNAKKNLATEAEEPYITITEIDVSSGNISEGAFEFDWNEFFIKELQKNGYVGMSDEETVEMWFRDICKHVVLETYEQADADLTKVTKEDLGDGLSSYS